jgi:iron complex outermembrane receptor protein
VHDPVAGLHGVLGLQARSDDFSAEGDEGYIPKTDSSELGLFLLEDFHRGDWTYELGVRGDWVKRDPETPATGSAKFNTLSGSASALWRLDPAWQLGASLSRAARAPASEELFSNVEATSPNELVVHAATGLIEVGNPDLDEETSLDIDLSLDWTGARSWVNMAVFYNRFQDYIFLSNSGAEVDGTPVYPYEQDGAKFYGVELETELHVMDLWSGALSVSLFGDVIAGEFDDGKDVPRLPPFRLGSEISWSNDNLGAWLKALKAADQDHPGEFETDTDGYTRWDLGADYHWRLGGENELLVFMKWKNFTNEEIRLSTSFLRNYAPEAGRSIEVGLRYSF